jgi:hypothetical protein
MYMSRHAVRLVGAALAATMATIYFLIGLGVLDIGTATTGDSDPFGFGMSAGSLFLIGAALLVLFDKRWLWALAIVFQVLVYAIYVGASAIRVPPFEVWGITLRVIQAPLLLALIYLAVKPTDAAPARQAQTPRGTM